ncbi:glycosyltransferase family 4 protein [Flavihumibacter cheonanensis]|uniref:glycosyltransferase family 4 protein n=1 Tax=Flavihumibacter cheonanensis TaxID=1442385 RepID=UPI001EF94C12|nr:glycosyltransferase family 4 protein [Flavihumibacter cheonanensis]MCG7753878.1 glycosyltransferase family 4 protein [Flavihumibacter cheonanensis]
MAEKNIVIVNQAVNYLTIGLCNSFNNHGYRVTLITGSIHTQGEYLHSNISVKYIAKWKEKPAFSKLRSYLWGTIQIWWLLISKFRNNDVLFVSIPPNAYLLSIILPNRCSMLIWDVYPDSFKILGMDEKHILYRIWSYFNKIAFKKSYKIFTIGDRMAELLGQYVNSEKLLITPIWSIFQKNERVAKNENYFVHKHNLMDKFVVQYSGNIGMTHNVELLVEIAKLLKDESDILFLIIGRGPRADSLIKYVEEQRLNNCLFLPFQSDTDFPYSLSSADLGVVILDGVTSKGSIPSKTYNLMSFGIPILSITSKESELHDYSIRFNYGKSFDGTELRKAAEFIKEIKMDKDIYNQMSKNSLEAAKNFRRNNADKIIELYMNDNNL